MDALRREVVQLSECVFVATGAERHQLDEMRGLGLATA